MSQRRAWQYAFIAISLALSVVACGTGNSTTINGFTRNADGYSDITVDELAGMMADKDFTLVNVHIPYEGELPDTDLFIPFDEITEHTDELPAEDATIILYCRSGSMSTTAAKDLVELGYENILELDGGFRAWEAAGYELLDTR